MRGIPGVVVAVIAAIGGVACQPAPPVPVLVVNDHGAGGDAHPGDGVCETTGGDGVCTMRAAFDEGNALGRADIEVPWSIQESAYSYGEVIDATIAGNLAVRGTDVPPGADPRGPYINLAVAPGATLTLDGVGLYLQSPLSVEGTLLTHRVTLIGDPLVVAQSGTAVLVSTLVNANTDNPGPAILNRGRIVARFVSVTGTALDNPTVLAEVGSTTDFGASWLSARSTQACVGPVTSSGYTAAFDDTCGLTAVGDQPNHWYDLDDFFEPLLPLHEGIDAVPPGTFGCGTHGATDYYGMSRARDADGDGIAQCDLGAVEVQASS